MFLPELVEFKGSTNAFMLKQSQTASSNNPILMYLNKLLPLI